MKWFLDLGNRYAAKSDWTDFALTKFCLCAMGILLGIRVKPEQKKVVGIGALLVFLATYVPLMSKVFAITKEKTDDKRESLRHALFQRLPHAYCQGGTQRAASGGSE